MDTFYHSNELDIYCGDCVKVMSELPSEFVDLTVTSPPYDKLRSYNGYAFDFENVAKELYRVTKRGGVLVWVVGDATIRGSETGTSFEQALFFKEVGFSLHDTMIYRKLNHPPLTHNRYEPEFEYMFVLSRSRPLVFNPIMVPCRYAGAETWGESSYYKTADSVLTTKSKRTISLERIKGNIWEYRTGSTQTGGIAHPAVFPEALAQDHILSWSKEGDTVFDPMCGSGTTLKMALLNNRKAIGIDISEDYCVLSTVRCLSR